MSAKQMGLVFEHEFQPNEQIVMLALADHANHDGENMFPSVSLLAWKTGYSERNIKRILKHLRDGSGVIEKQANHGNGMPTTYKFNWSKAKRKEARKDPKSDILSPPSESAKSDSAVTPTVTNRVSKSDTAMSPKPSYNHQEPSTIENEVLENAKQKIIEGVDNPYKAFKRKYTKAFDAYEKIARVKRYNYAVKEAQSEQLLKLIETHGENAFIETAQKTLLGIGDLNNPIAYLSSQIGNITNSTFHDVVKKDEPSYKVGQKVKTPLGEEEVIDVTKAFVITEQGNYFHKDVALA